MLEHGENMSSGFLLCGEDRADRASTPLCRLAPHVTKKRREAPAFMPGMDRRWARRAQCPRAQQDPRSA
jgi:hypothetical protein